MPGKAPVQAGGRPLHAPPSGLISGSVNRAEGPGVTRLCLWRRPWPAGRLWPAGWWKPLGGGLRAAQRAHVEALTKATCGWQSWAPRDVKPGRQGWMASHRSRGSQPSQTTDCLPSSGLTSLSGGGRTLPCREVGLEDPRDLPLSFPEPWFLLPRGESHDKLNHLKGTIALSPFTMLLNHLCPVPDHLPPCSGLKAGAP